MLTNYLKVAVRNLGRHKGYAAINVLGLAVGMAVCVLIVLFVRDELSYDRFHEHADRVYRIVSEWDNFSVPATNPPFVRTLQADYPELEVAKLLKTDGLVRHGARAFEEERIYFANPAVFDVFTFPLDRGDPATALQRPFTAVLTTAMAEKYFPSEDPIGQTIAIDNQFEAEVTGIAEPVPENAHFHFDFLVSFASLDAAFNYSSSNNWGNNSIYTYLLLPPGMAPETLEAQFPDFIERHAGANWNGAAISLQPLTDIHLHSHHNMELEPNSRMAYVYIFSVIAGFILLIACVNFMNLATARSMERAKEVGVRKAVGARRGQLMRQFIVEALLLAGVALLLAVALVALALPAFRILSGKGLTVGLLGEGFTMAALVAVALVAGLLAGSYPAFALSGFRPIAVLRGRIGGVGQGAWLRRGLVVFQFAISVILIIGTAVVYSQLDYLRSAGLGFDQEHVVVLPMPGNPSQTAQMVAQYPAFKNEMQQQSGVTAVSISSEELPSELLNGSVFRFAAADSGRGLRTVAVGHDFFEALGAEMIAGRAFSQAFPSDSGAYVVNAEALDLLASRLPEPLDGPEEAIGRPIVGGGRAEGPLIGVVEDFNMATLHEQIEPIIFYLRPEWYDTYLVRVAPGAVSATLAQLRDVWQQFYPDWPFDYRFADQAFDAQYRAEERLAQIVLAFSGLAIFIACLGLFGLAAFMAERRTKEIGIRKALGASAASIVGLLSKEFAQLVLVAFGVATPVAYLAMRQWLQDFAYHIDLGVGFFLGAGALALLIALLTVSYQSIRAATTDPIKALRYE